jgi:hypothetical protein
MKGDRVNFRCLDCNRWVVTSAWSRYAGAQRCGPCYRAQAARLAQHAAQARVQRETGVEQGDLPLW